MNSTEEIFQGAFFRTGNSWRALADLANREEKFQGIATLLFEEADHLDSWRLDEWLAMYAEECVYWVPIVYDADEPSSHNNLIFDNRALLEDRVYRLQTGQVPSQDPPSRTVRALSNLTVSATDVDEEFLVRSRFSLGERRPRATRTYIGRYIHRIRREEGWRLLGKRISLLTSDAPLPSLTFLL